MSRPPKASGVIAPDKHQAVCFFIFAPLPPALAQLHDALDKRDYNASRLPN
jgi:hypothetical protein